MPEQIWNLGRVVGYSSYEVYVKQQQSIDPTNPPASERQWLASSLAMGSSMLLQINSDINHADNENWIYEVQFPSNSNLCAANTIIASFFDGHGEYGGPWANRISDYGSLISNTSTSSPSGNVGTSGTVPSQSDVLDNWSQSKKSELLQYMKIVDGIVIQPGTWSDAGSTKPPEKDFIPNLSLPPRLRLLIKGPISTAFQILLTGFTIRTVVVGEVGLDGSIPSPAPQNGDFLGPGQYPWANKIIFSVPTSYITYFENSAYTRKLPSSSTTIATVKDTPVIDMTTTKPETYYELKHQSARVPINVEEYSTVGLGTGVLTVYQKNAIYPPALYGTFVDSIGINYLNPLDVVAPGTVKMFQDASASDLKNYEDTFDGTFGVNKNSSDGTLEVLGPDGTKVPAASVSQQDLTYTNIVSSDVKAKGNITKAGNKQTLSLSVGTNTSGTQYTIGSDGTSNKSVGNTTYNVGSQTKLSPPTSNINLVAILEALANNKSIDILGEDLKALKAGLDRGYIQMPNGLRLYISSSQPTDTDVPIGSIGIGWGFNTNQ